MQIVRRHSAADAAGVSTTRAPAAASGATRSALMSWTITSNPALRRFNAIGPPMAPTPTNPTFPVMTILPLRSNGPAYCEPRRKLRPAPQFIFTTFEKEIDHGQEAD